MGNNVLTLTDATFDEHLANEEGLLLVDFWAEWCGPCRMLGPVLDALAAEAGDKVTLVKVNVDENPGLAARHGIRSIPTVLFIRDGKVLDQVVGAVPKGILRQKVDALASA